MRPRRPDTSPPPPLVGNLVGDPVGAARGSHRGRGAGRGDGLAPLRVALINNMPEAAFADTDHQFSRLLAGGQPGHAIDIRRYSIPVGVARELPRNYLPLDHLFEHPPDALVLTGSKPQCTNLRDERIWSGLETVIRWAETSVSSALLSCLASHAALLTLDGIGRTPLETKLSGVYDQQVDATHPITASMDNVAFPHSRLNDVPAAVVKRHGYAVPIRSEKIGWTVAVRDRGCLFVLLQGHPEYSAGALLKEYRRDVRSYLEGGRSQYPRIPVHYFSAGAVKELEGFKRMATSGTAHPGLMSEFPFASAAKGINYVWERPAQQLFAGWLAEVRRRQALSAASLRAPL